jgi:small subunit ribosomal protein S16
MQKMAIVMRLARFGGKKNPFYRIVVSDSRFPRDGRFIENIGTYDPNKNPAEVHIMEDRAMEWYKRGAQPTRTVRNLLRQSGILKKLAQEG